MTSNPITSTGQTETEQVDRDWLAVFASGCGLFLSSTGLSLYTFGVFMLPLHAHFGWSRTQLSISVLIAQCALGLSAPFWGWQIDRFGPRMILIPTTLLLALLIASLSGLTPHLPHFYLTYFLISFLGPSPILYPSVIVRIFDRRLGLALGLTLAGTGLGATVLPPLAQFLIGSYGWRGAYLGLGVITVLVSLPAALVATRHVRGPAPRRTDPTLPSLLPLLRTRTFVLICVTFFLLGFVTVGVFAHLVPMMVGHGYTPAAAARIAGLTGFATIISRAGFGWVMDRVQAQRALASVALLAVAAFLLLALGSGRALPYLAAILLGGVIGAEGDFMSYLTRRHFPQPLFGRLIGLVFLMFAIGSGGGPVLMSWSFDHLGGYRPALLLSAALGIVTSVTALALPRYRPGQA